jgi:Cu-Zn family superoxide dismutase
MTIYFEKDPSLVPFVAECRLFDHEGHQCGIVTFQEQPSVWLTRIEVKVWNQTPGLHGIHIHEKGADVIMNMDWNGKCCDKLGGHYNPYNAVHGDLGDDFTRRHVGDMGNMLVGNQGCGYKVFSDRLIRLRGRFSVIGRSVIFHKDRDDLGRGNNKESLKTGNSGKRILCGVIERLN